MKKAGIRIGGVYQTKINGVLARVRIDYECASGGWMGTNLDSGNSVLIKNVGRLRKAVETESPATVPQSGGNP